MIIVSDLIIQVPNDTILDVKYHILERFQMFIVSDLIIVLITMFQMGIVSNFILRSCAPFSTSSYTFK